MKQTTKHTIRRWTGLMLAMCILGLMLPVGALADEPFYGVYTGGIEDNSHDADHEPLGDLVFPDSYILQGNENNFAALNLVFPDEEGGGNVSIKAGDIKTETDCVDEFHSYNTPGNPADGWVDSHGVYGAYVSMRDESTLKVETGKIDAAGGAVGIDLEDSSKLTMNIDGTVSGSGGISVNATHHSEADISAKDINAHDGSGIYVKENDCDDVSITIDGSVTASLDGIGINTQIDDESKMNILVTGDVNAEQGRGIHVNNGYYIPPYDNMDGSVDPEVYGNGYSTISVKGDVEAGPYGIYLQNNAGEVTVTVGERDDDGRIISGGNVSSYGTYDDIGDYCDGLFLKTDKNSTTVFSAADVTSDHGNGMMAESEGEGSTVKVSVGDVQGWGGNGIYAAAWGEGSYTTLQAGDVFGSTIGVVLDADDGSYEANGEINAELGDIQGFESGLYVNSTDGKINVSAKNIDARDLNGVDVSLDGKNEGNGVTAVIDGDIQAGTNGVQVSTYANTRYLEDENGDYIEGPDGYYLTVTETPNSYADISVTGLINADINGIKTHNGGGDFSISAAKGVSVSAIKDDLPYYDHTITGVNAQAEAGKTTITIDGGVDVFWSDRSQHLEAAGYDDEDEDQDEDWDEDDWYDDNEEDFQGNGITIANKGGEVDISINGDVSAKDGTAVTMEVYRYPDDGPTTGTTALTVKGNVSAKDGLDINNLDNTTTVEITGDLKASANGARVITETGTATVEIGGDVTASAFGVGIQNSDGTVTMDIGGSVTAGEEYAAMVQNVGNEGGISRMNIGGDLTAGENGLKIVNYSGELDVEIAGDVTADNGTGITLSGQGPGWKNNGTAVVAVGGSLSGKNGIDVDFSGKGTGTAQIIVDGDLTAAEGGIKLGEMEEHCLAPQPAVNAGAECANEAENTDPAVDIVVEETISGGIPIFVANVEAAVNFLITTWAVRPNEDNQITADQYGESVRAVEESINYIIKKEDNEKYGTLNVAGTSEKTVGTAGPEGTGAEAAGGNTQGTHTLNVAKESKELTLSVDLKEEYRKGYEVVIYNGKGDNRIKAEVTKQENGNFTFVVPWAGGVYLSFDLEKLTDSEPDPEPGPDPEPDPDPEPEPEPAKGEEPAPEPGKDPVKEPENGPEEEQKKDPAPAPQQKTEPEPEKDDKESGKDIDTDKDDDTDKDTDTGSDSEGRVLAILYGEEEAYTIWFLTGYAYKAEFKDGYTETGSYSVKDGILTLTAKDGSKRTADENWNMAFGDELTAEIVKADFSDSVKVIGEFNLNDDSVLEITDDKQEALDLGVISSSIDNPQAFDILKAILPEEA